MCSCSGSHRAPASDSCGDRLPTGARTARCPGARQAVLLARDSLDDTVDGVSLSGRIADISSGSPLFTAARYLPSPASERPSSVSPGLAAADASVALTAAAPTSKAQRCPARRRLHRRRNRARARRLRNPGIRAACVVTVNAFYLEPMTPLAHQSCSVAAYGDSAAEGAPVVRAPPPPLRPRSQASTSAVELGSGFVRLGGACPWARAGVISIDWEDSI